MGTPELRIRVLESVDEAFLRELSASAFGEYAPDAARSTLWMAEHHPTWIALRGEQRVGFAILRPAGRERAELLAIAVVETERGRGVGRALIERVEAAARARGAAGITLHTADANVAAIDLFRKRGFRVARHLRRYYQNVFDACEMRKDF
ncbi:MAG: GNAT family N-acetyltransferase [Polyangiaceae bacterium]